ncbi:transcription elongation factor SPT5-like [Antechinus flavipes]|uniref:transcription elongation factor SPT5-like n=1 Tax=Antechinus flavipes TaxID=38775 RepID=UPI00223650E0|nr:transcription elongation factor SPT5-like [Antechinus flavipes]
MSQGGPRKGPQKGKAENSVQNQAEGRGRGQGQARQTAMAVTVREAEQSELRPSHSWSECESRSRTESESESESESGSGSESESVSKSGSWTHSPTGSKSKLGSGTGTRSESESVSGTESRSGSESESESLEENEDKEKAEEDDDDEEDEEEEDRPRKKPRHQGFILDEAEEDDDDEEDEEEEDRPRKKPRHQGFILDEAEEDDDDEEEEEEEDRPRKKPRHQGFILDEAEEDDDDEEEEEEEDRPRKKPRHQGFILDEAEEDDDDEEDEEEEDRPRKKPRHQGFILDEAEENDDKEEEEEEAEWEVGAEDIVDRARLPGPGSPEAYLQNDCSGARRLQNAWRDQREEELAQYFMQKYATSSSRAARRGVPRQPPDHIAQQRLLPGIRDPKLWMVKCKLGQEKATALTLLRKFLASRFSDNPLQIQSVVAPEYLKGYIYVEAHKLCHVLDAIQGVANLRLGCRDPKPVPVGEMTDVLKVLRSQAPDLQPGSWVRVREGLYKGDLGQVTRSEPGNSTVFLKMIPRIDYSLIAGLGAPTLGFPKRKRPPQKLLDAQKIRSLGGKLGSDGDFLLFRGDRYSPEGFLFKTFSQAALVTEGVRPTLSELQRFEERPEALQKLELRLDADGAAERSFRAGDKVRVSAGDLINLRGRVVSVQGPHVTMMPEHELLRDPLQLAAGELCKYFEVGEHVQVLAGRYLGTTGFVLRVEPNYVLLLSDLGREEIKVLPGDLRLCPDTAAPEDAWGRHRWGELVQLSPGTVGVVVGLDAEALQILDMQDQVVTVRRQAVTARKDNHLAVALDGQQNSVRVRDSVRVVEGPRSGLQATVLHLFRGIAFLRSKTLTEHGGLFACKCRHLLLAGAAQSSRGRDLSAGGLTPGPSPHPTSPRYGPERGAFESVAAGGRDRGSRGPGDRHPHKGLLGQSVRIFQGPYKGYIGRVKEVTEDLARVELHSTCQTICVHPQRLAPLGAARQALQSADSATPPSSSFQTPTYGSFTPMYSGTYTPIHVGGAWDPSIGNTPSHL